MDVHKLSRFFIPSLIRVVKEDLLDDMDYDPPSQPHCKGFMLYVLCSGGQGPFQILPLSRSLIPTKGLTGSNGNFSSLMLRTGTLDVKLMSQSTC